MMPTNALPLNESRIAPPWAAMILAMGFGAMAMACGDGTDGIDELELSVRLAPDPLDFGALQVGAVDEATLLVLNDGNGTIELDGPLIIEGGGGAFSITGEEQAFPLAPGANASLTVRFEPTAIGAVDARLRLTPIGGDAFTASFAGEGEPSALVFSPADIDFGEVWAGESADETVRVENTGTSPLAAVLRLDSSGFALDGTSAVSIDLDPGEESEHILTFSPRQSGRLSADLVAETCGTGCGPKIALTGFGLAPRIDVLPRPIDFGEVAPGTEATTTVSISNGGAGTLTIQRTTLAPEEVGLSIVGGDLEPFTLNAGDEVTIELAFAPTTPQAAFAGTLTLESNDILSPRVAVPIIASVPGRALELYPSAIHLGHLSAGTTATSDIILRADGTLDATVTSARFEGDGADAFFLDDFPMLPLTLSPGTTFVGSIGAMSDLVWADAGGASAVLVVDGDFGTQSLNVTFSAGSVGCVPRAQPKNADIGYVKVGQGGNQRTLVHNDGIGTCVISSVGPAPGLPYDPGFSHAAYDTSIVPGGTAEVAFAYQAASVGSASAFVELALGDNNAPILLSATAQGVAGSLLPQPASKTFGPVVQHCGEEMATILFVNDGAQDVLITALELDGPHPEAFELTLFDALPITVPPGGFTEMRVKAYDNTAGLFAASIRADTVLIGSVSASLSSEVALQGTTIVETFDVGEAPDAVDVLFIIDNSGSMEDDQLTLASNFGDFIAAASIQSGPDFHIGITTTDMSPDTGQGGNLVGMPAVMTASMGNLVSHFEATAKVGTMGSGLELGLRAMEAALSEPAISGANAAFLRPDAALSIIVVSDEDDSEGVFAGPAARPVESYLSFLESLKAGTLTEAPVIFSGVITPYAPRYREMIEAFGGLELDINSPDWGAELNDLGAATFNLSRVFLLGSEVSNGMVTVFVDGQPITDYSFNGRTVTLDDAPSPGTQVVIEYGAACPAP